MKFIVSNYTETNGYPSESIDWEFDDYEEARKFFESYDLVSEFATEVSCGGRRSRYADTEFVLSLSKEEELGLLTLDVKTAGLADLDD